MVNIYTELILLRMANRTTELAEFAGFVRQGVDRMSLLISDLLQFSRATTSQRQNEIGIANLDTAFSEALCVLNSHVAESGARITTQSLPIVRGDTRQLSHVFQNLLSNALKYRDPARCLELSITSQQQGSEWVISVQDNGIGFEPMY